MLHEITIQVEDGEFQTKSFQFPGGEVQVQIPDFPDRIEGDVRVISRVQSPASLIQLLLLDEILTRAHNYGWRTLVIPYFPYARQDRVMAHNEAFSLKGIARLVNGMDFDRVVICDPHSDVASALIEGVEVVGQLELVKAHADLQPILNGVFVSIVAPDAGAAKKASAVAKHYGLSLVTASKTRDVATGAITGTELHNPVLGRDAVIVDDICDGGRTFIELAKVLRQAGAEKVFLYVTHGIFSQGMGVFDGVIDAIYTTDAFLSEDVAPSSVPLFVLPIKTIGA